MKNNICYFTVILTGIDVISRRLNKIWFLSIFNGKNMVIIIGYFDSLISHITNTIRDEDDKGISFWEKLEKKQNEELFR
jgi:hypothetical protein